MKKLIPLALSAMLVSLASCGDTSSQPSSAAPSSTPTSVPSVEPSSETTSPSSESSKEPTTMEFEIAQRFMFVGDELPLSVSIEHAESNAVTWSVSGDHATISDTGVLTAVSVGEVTVTVTLNEDPTITRSQKIEVKDVPSSDAVLEDAETVQTARNDSHDLRWLHRHLTINPRPEQSASEPRRNERNANGVAPIIDYLTIY